MIRVALALAFVPALGCTEHIRFDTQLTGLVAIELAPLQTTLVIDDLDGAPRTLAFTATGTFTDGSSEDISSLVSWTVDAPALGAIDDHGLYTATGAGAGHVAIAASGSGISATTALTIEVDATIFDPAFPLAGDPGALFPPGATPITGDPMHSPSLLYPIDGTAFPQGVATTLVQYTPGAGNDSYRIRLDNDVLHLVVYTSSPRWAADSAVWSAVALSGIGAPIQLAVDATASAAPGPVYGAAAITLDFSPDAPGGALDYWSAATNGIMRGALSAHAAGKLYPVSTGCVGCHTASRDGSALALGASDENNPTLQTLSLPALVPQIDTTANLHTGWSTFSPDASLVLVAHDGVLALYDAKTGAPSGSVALPAMTFATHPDWSPDGTQVAVALTQMKPTDKDVNNASIALVPITSGQLGAPQILVAHTGNENNYFPRWSPDGQFLAYIHATTSSHAAASAELRLVRASGGSPIVLTAASSRDPSAPPMGLADTMPAWAPAGGRFAWLAFASTRPYGTVTPMPKNAQIWVTGLDLASLDSEGTTDPSFAAFWLPCQDVMVVNHTPIWLAR